MIRLHSVVPKCALDVILLKFMMNDLFSAIGLPNLLLN